MALAFFRYVYFSSYFKKLEAAIGLSVAVIVALTLTTPLNNLIYHKLLSVDGILGVDLTFLGFLSYIGVIAASVQILEMFLDKYVPALYNTLGGVSTPF